MSRAKLWMVCSDAAELSQGPNGSLRFMNATGAARSIASRATWARMRAQDGWPMLNGSIRTAR